MRTADLCDGGADGPLGCGRANDAKCKQCGAVRFVEDTNVLGSCPECGSRNSVAERCARCPLDDLDYARAHSAAGRLLNRLLDLEFKLKRLQVPWTEITEEEIKGLQTLESERENYHREQNKSGQQ